MSWRAQAPGRSVLTTQLFFADVTRNRSDLIFDTRCLVRGWRLVRGRRVARFDLVWAAAHEPREPQLHLGVLDPPERRAGTAACRR